MCYFDVVIKDKQFFLKEDLSEKPKGTSGLHLLGRIEEILQKKLEYGKADDVFSQLPLEERYAKLKTIAERIHNGYTAKAVRLSKIRKLFAGVEKKIVAIGACFSRIVSPPPSPTVFGLPKDMSRHLLSFLNTNDLINVAGVNQTGKDEAHQAIIERAREYDFGDSPFHKAKKDLEILYQGIIQIDKDGRIPKGCRVISRKGLFSSSIDVEATVRNIKSAKEKLSSTQHLLDHALRYYSIEGNLTACEALIQIGANVNTQDFYGNSALLLSAQKCQVPVMKFLLEKGADPNLVNNNSQSPLIAALESLENITGMLRDAPPEREARQTIEICKLLLNAGGTKSINQFTQSGFTPLHFAIYYGFSDIVQLLIDHGADTNLPNQRGNTPLFLAVYNSNRNQKICRMILDHGGVQTIDQLGSHGNNALHYAIKTCQYDTVELLLRREYGANRNIVTALGNTPMDLAGEDRRMRILLLK